MTMSAPLFTHTAPATRYDIPKLELRRRSDEHPMAMFGAIVVTAFLSMATFSVQGSAQAAVDPATASTGGPLTTEKSARLPISDTDDACRGQAWGAESIACLAVIAKDSGKGEARKVRMVAADQANTTTPNIF